MKLGHLFIPAFAFLFAFNSSAQNKAFADSNNTFSLDLYKSLYSEKNNTFISPYSISSLMAMLYAGANNKTEKEISKTFHFGQNPNKINQNFSESNTYYSQLPEIKLNIANAIWVRNFNQIKPDYINKINKYYQSAINPLIGAKSINDWASAKTEGKITEVVSEGDVSSAEMILNNAIYFKGDWLKTFKTSDTKKDKFKLLNGQTIDVDMMFQIVHTKYYKDPNNQCEVLELLYKGEGISMYIILPTGKQSITKLSEQLTLDDFNTYIKGINKDYTNSASHVEASLYFPKFSIKSEFELNDYLIQMGLKSAFTDSADFSGMIPGTHIGFIKHQTVLQVDETGTVAAAVTTGSAERDMPEPIEFRVNRPFMVFICDKKTNSILFMGSVLNPNK